MKGADDVMVAVVVDIDVLVVVDVTVFAVNCRDDNRRHSRIS